MLNISIYVIEYRIKYFVFQTIVGDHLSSLLIQVFSSESSLSAGTIIGNNKIEALTQDQDLEDAEESDSKSLASGVFFFPDPNHCDGHDSSADLYKDSHNDDDDDDDNTASTFDMMDEDEYPVSPCSSFRSSVHSDSPIQSERRQVHFPEQLVTHIYTRPLTTREDKYYLHYDEHDYMDFKLQYRADILGVAAANGGRRRSSSSSSNNTPIMYYRKSGSKRVSFKRDVIDSIHPVMDLPSRKKIQHDLFYTEHEMRQFLDEFVVSLQQLQHGQQEQQQQQ